MVLRLLGRRGGSSAAAACTALQQMQTLGVATFAIRPAEPVLEPDLVLKAPSPRTCTAAVARRQQWSTLQPSDEVPRSVEAAMMNGQDCSQARIITEAAWPHRVVWANKAWEQLCGWSAEEAVGRHGLSFMQGAATEPTALRTLNDAVREGGRVAVTLTNYKKDGSPFTNALLVLPLRTAVTGEYRHMLGILSEVK